MKRRADDVRNKQLIALPDFTRAVENAVRRVGRALRGIRMLGPALNPSARGTVFPDASILTKLRIHMVF